MEVIAVKKGDRWGNFGGLTPKKGRWNWESFDVRFGFLDFGLRKKWEGWGTGKRDIFDFGSCPLAFWAG